MKILAIGQGFPCVKRPYHGVFFKRLLAEFVKLGHEVTAILPERSLFPPSICSEEIQENICILRPGFFSFGWVPCLRRAARKATHLLFIKSVMRTIQRKKVVPDAVYSHFLVPSGAAAVKVGTRLNLPSFCTLGESTLDIHERTYSRPFLQNLAGGLTGLFFHSYHAMETAVSRLGLKQERCWVVPNGVDQDMFQPRSRTECRKKLGFPLRERIVIFVGSFIERKGPLRVLRACEFLAEQPKMIFVGDGPQKPASRNLLFAGVVDPGLLSEYLSAADVFVLPTMEEGMSNAILEALACGLPVVTSPLPSNREVLGADFQLYCDPSSIASIAEKITRAFGAKMVAPHRLISLKTRAGLILQQIQDSVR